MADRSRRRGYRRGAMSAELQSALAGELTRISEVADPADRVRAIGDLFAALDVETAEVAAIRLDAVATLRAEGLTYQEISKKTGLSVPRVAVLAREAGAGGRARKSDKS